MYPKNILFNFENRSTGWIMHPKKPMHQSIRPENHTFQLACKSKRKDQICKKEVVFCYEPKMLRRQWIQSQEI